MIESPQSSAAEHPLVARALQAAEQANARRVLLVSAYRGDGKSYLARCIARHAHTVTDEPVEILPLDLEIETPRADRKRGYQWLDGLALLEGRGASMLTPSFRASLDGALFVARGMATTRAEVADCAERLKVLGVPVLGGVWNERDHPPAAEALSSLKAELKNWPSRWLPSFLYRQTRRSHE